jgi:hypothetical protein
MYTPVWSAVEYTLVVPQNDLSLMRTLNENRISFSGLRFGLMQVKMGLAILVSRFQFDICEKSQVPLIMDPKKFVMNTTGGLWLKMTPRAQ